MMSHQSGGTPGAEPPRLSRRLVAALLPTFDRTHVLADLDELFAVRVARDGARRARWWYRRQCLGFLVRLAGERARPDGEIAPGRIAAALATEARLASRALIRLPRYTSAAVVTLGIGIAAVTTVYSVATWVLERPTPGIDAPGELVTAQLESTEGWGGRWPISQPDLVEITQRTPSARLLAAYTPQDLHLATRNADAPERVAGEIVTPNYFATLGVRMAAGRAFADDAGRPETDVAIISHTLWQRHWDTSPSAVGDRIILNGQRFTVIGVAPDGFRGVEIPGRSQLWVTAGAVPSLMHDPDVLTDRGRQLWGVLVARPRITGATDRIAREMNAGIAAIRAGGGNHSFLATHMVFRTYAGVGLPPLMRDRMRSAMRLLTAAAALLLALTCANVANLSLLRALSLRTATAVRRALGAGLARLARERLVESSLVGLAGAATGVVLSALLIRAASGIRIAGVELDVDASAIEPSVIGLAVVVSLAAGWVVGLLPALSVRGENGTSLLRSARHGDARSARMRTMLVVLQVALSAVLVVSAGLLSRTLWNLRHVDLGISTRNVLTFSVDPELQGYDERRTATLIAGLLARLGDDPRVDAAAVVDFAPFTSLYIPATLARTGADPNDLPVSSRGFRVSPSFFAALGLPMLAGEGFPANAIVRDTLAPELAVLNLEAARLLFPGVSPGSVVGRTVWRPRYIGKGVGQPRPTDRPIRIVGIVPNARLGGFKRGVEPYVFRPWSQGPRTGRFTVYAHTTVAPEQLAGRAREIVRNLDAALPVYGIGTLDEDVARLTADQRFAATLAATLGAVALLLAALGLYGLLAYAVVERRREIGIRTALGALPRSILASVVRDGLVLTLIGLALGLAAAAAVSRVLESRLFGVTPLDTATYVAGGMLLLAVAGAASLVPARRAVRLDVVEVLREEA